MIIGVGVDLVEISRVRSMIASQGYRAAFITTGVIQGLVILLVAQVLRHPGHRLNSRLSGNDDTR